MTASIGASAIALKQVSLFCIFLDYIGDRARRLRRFVVRSGGVASLEWLRALVVGRAGELLIVWWIYGAGRVRRFWSVPWLE